MQCMPSAYSTERIKEETMERTTALSINSVFAVTTLTMAHAQDSSVTIVLSKELDTVDPCEASQSKAGRVLRSYSLLCL